MSIGFTVQRYGSKRKVVGILAYDAMFTYWGKEIKVSESLQAIIKTKNPAVKGRVKQSKRINSIQSGGFTRAVLNFKGINITQGLFNVGNYAG